jgi:hypothetical protein
VDETVILKIFATLKYSVLWGIERGRNGCPAGKADRGALRLDLERWLALRSRSFAIHLDA